MSDTARVAIVTGAAKGIGRAIAAALAERGIVPVIADIDATGAEAVAESLRSAGKRALAAVADVSDPAQAARLVSDVLHECGRLDILVNNAGILSNSTYDQVGEEEWDRVMAVNLKSVMFLSREALRPMLARGWGRIVSISSLAGRSGGVSAGAAYVASKAAIVGLTRHLARKAAGRGVTVNCVAPGTTETDILKGFSAEDMEAINKSIPVGRLGRPEEVAETVAFLASDAAAFITGAVLDVNGGMYMG